MPEDKIIIYPNGKAYFSCKGDIKDKGDLTKFVLYRLDKFTNCTQTGYKGVNEVLSKYLGSDLKVATPTKTILHNLKIPSLTLTNILPVH